MLHGELKKDELSNLFKIKNIINDIKAQRLNWFGHVCRMTSNRIVKMLCEWKLISTSIAGRPNTWWENDIKEYFRIVKIIIG